MITCVAIHKRMVDCRVGLKVLLAMTFTTAGQRNELRSHRALVENLKSEHRANNAGGEVVLTGVVHTERTTRIGAEGPRVVEGVIRRRPNELIRMGRLSAIS